MINFSEFRLFEISLVALNLFSFMLGMVYAFFNQGMFGKNIARPIFIYFSCLVAYYAYLYYTHK